MKCVVCKESWGREDLVVLSPRAFSQIKQLIDNADKVCVSKSKDRPVYVCKNCFLTAYKPQQIADALT